MPLGESLLTSFESVALSEENHAEGYERKKPLDLRQKAPDLNGSSNRTKPEPFGREHEILFTII